MPGYISEFNIFGGSTEFVEMAIPTGTDTSAYSLVVYNGAGGIAATLSLGSVEGTGAGKDVYVVTPGEGLPNLGYTDALALVGGDGTVLQFLSWQGTTVTASTGPAAGQTSTDIGNASFGTSFETTDGGASYSQQATENPGVIPCFAAGTEILTPDGPRPIETLRIGDPVVTAYGQVKPVRWLSHRDVCFRAEPDRPRPIRIAAGALGAGRPATDLVMSSQHRIAVGAFGQLEALFIRPALVPAKSLLRLGGIREMRGRSRIAWHHVLLDDHDLLIANIAIAESLFLGPMVARALARGRSTRTRTLLDRPAPVMPLMRVGAVHGHISAARFWARKARHGLRRKPAPTAQHDPR